MHPIKLLTKYEKNYTSKFFTFSWVSLTPLINIHLWISPQIFKKIWNGPNGIFRSPGKTDTWKNLKLKISCQTPFNCEENGDHNRSPEEHLKDKTTRGSFLYLKSLSTFVKIFGFRLVAQPLQSYNSISLYKVFEKIMLSSELSKKILADWCWTPVTLSWFVFVIILSH